jgi:uncharacterized heparinase superfamily protein
MSPSAVGSRVLLGWLVTRSARQAAAASLFASRFYRWRFTRAEPERLVLAPQDLRTADPTRAAEIIAGRYAFGGKSVELHNVSPFIVKAPSPAWAEALYGFTWLRHLRAADGIAGRNAARSLVGEFVRSPVRFSPEALNPLTTARRVLAWVSQAPLALDGADRGFYRAFIRSLSWQAHYLLRAGQVGRDGMPRLLCAIAATQASLCLSDKGTTRRRATRWLTAELDRQILPDGGHLSRNPQAIIDLLLELLPLRQSFAARNFAPPQELMGAIDRMMPMLRFFRHADGAFAAFNGMGYTQAHLVATLLAYDDARGRPVQNAPHAGYQRVDAGGSVLIIDTGTPPPIAVSQEAHAGTLSFEFSADHHRIIVNCGSPGQGREKLRQLARATPAHSTATIGNRSCAVIGRPAGLQRLLDSPIVSGPRNVTVERREARDAVTLLARHDGYRAAFGVIHERELSLRLETGALYGRESFLTPTGTAWRGRHPVTLRFHLHPGVSVAQAGEDTVSLSLPGGSTWNFRTENQPLSLEESVHFANPEGPRRCAQIVIDLPRASGEAVPTVLWSLEPTG